MSLDHNKNGEPAPLPSFSLSFTQSLLRQYYSTVCTLKDLLPAQGGTVTRQNDSESFQRLVGETVVASRSLTGAPKLSHEANGRASGAAMSEVSPNEEALVHRNRAKTACGCELTPRCCS